MMLAMMIEVRFQLYLAWMKSLEAVEFVLRATREKEPGKVRGCFKYAIWLFEEQIATWCSLNIKKHPGVYDSSVDGWMDGWIDG
jgi:hypothetical protein